RRLRRRLRVGEGRDEARCRGDRGAGLAFEEGVEGGLHLRAVPSEDRGERFPVGEIHRLGDERAVLVGAWERLRLLVVVVLEAMLEAAEGRGRLAARRNDRRVT